MACDWQWRGKYGGNKENPGQMLFFLAANPKVLNGIFCLIFCQNLNHSTTQRLAGILVLNLTVNHDEI